MSQPTIIAYRRVSSQIQTKGHGLSMQAEKELLQRLSAEHGIPIDGRIFEDKGRSAFKGAHLRYEFGRLNALIDSGDIVPKSIIVVSSLDRISRADVEEAQELLLSIINRGIWVYTSIDDKLFQKGSRSLTVDLIMSILSFSRANEESRVKSSRGRSAVLKAIEAHNNGARSPEGYPLKMSGNRLPFWIDGSQSDVRAHPVYFPIIQEIIQKLFDGYGTHQLLHWLNATHPAPHGRHSWARSTMSKIHHYESLKGVLVIKSADGEHRLENYFPPVLTNSEFDRLRRLRASKHRRATGRNAVSLLVGTGIPKCGNCGGSVRSLWDKRRQSLSYGCMTKAHAGDCSGFTAYAPWLDKALVLLCKDLVWEASESAHQDDPLSPLKTAIKALENQLSVLSEACMSEGTPRVMISKMIQLEKELEAKKEKLRTMALHIPADVDTLKLKFRWEDAAVAVCSDVSNVDERLKLKSLFVDSFKSVTINKKKGEKDYTLDVEFIDGRTRTGTVIDGNLEYKTWNVGGKKINLWVGDGSEFIDVV